LGFVFVSLVAGALSAVAATGGCQSDSGGDDDGSGNSGNQGSGGSGASSAGGNASNSGGTGNTGTNSGGTGNTGGGASCDADERTIEEITTGAVGEGIIVNVKGVVAMSYKFLVSGPGNSGNCLWGVYVSAPGLTETAPNSGALVVAYGTEATTSDGGTFCPKNGVEPTGGNIPDDVVPGDVLDINAKVNPFVLDACATEPNGTTVAQIQLASNSTSCPIVKTGTAPLPTPATLTAAQLEQLSSPTDTAFHNQWGGVKVRIENVTPVPFTEDCPTMATPPCMVNKYGEIAVEEGGLLIKDRTYYRGYLKDNKCHTGPVFGNSVTTFTRIDGFSSLDYCTWVLQPLDKCADFAPPSEDCAGDATCPLQVP
jgi:hypothetical protein